MTQRPAPADADDRRYVTALARGLEVLSCFRSGEKLLGNQDIAMRCGLPKSTVSRLTATLTALGYLLHVPQEGKYRLGTATLALGSAMLSGLDVRQLARPLGYHARRPAGPARRRGLCGHRARLHRR